MWGGYIRIIEGVDQPKVIMELPQSMQDALSLAGESIHIPDAQFPSFVEVAFRGVINSNERNAIESMYSRYSIPAKSG